MKCIKCGRPVGVGRYCNACGFDNKHIAKALNTADYYYNIGLEKAQMHDLSGAEMYLKKALTYNKSHKNERNLLCLVYNEMGEGGIQQYLKRLMKQQRSIMQHFPMQSREVMILR